jgi:hypothetical protein
MTKKVVSHWLVYKCCTSASATMFFVILVAVGILAWRSLINVKPGQRIVVWKRFGANAGRLLTLEPGSHMLNPLAWVVFGQGPFVGLVSGFPPRACPAPLSTVSVDPDRVEIMSSDRVPGTADVAVELQVLEWSASEIVAVNIPFLTRASTIIKQWVSNVLCGMDANRLCSYAEVVSCLNATENLKILNENLRECFLEAKRISVDARGIQLHETYTETIGTVIQKNRLLTLQRLSAQAEMEHAEQRHKRELIETQAKCEREKYAAEVQRAIEKSKADGLASRASALIAAGLNPAHVANILSAEVSVAALAKAEKVYVGMPSAVVGLRGADHLMISDTFEKL